MSNKQDNAAYDLLNQLTFRPKAENFVSDREDLSDRQFFLDCLSVMKCGSTGPSSFEIHAALEMVARQCLFPWVSSAHKAAARLRMAETALKFADVAQPLDPVPEVKAKGRVSSTHSWDEIAAYLYARDLPRELLRQLIPRVVGQIGGAGHVQILLGHLITIDDIQVRRLLWPHLYRFLRAYAANPATEDGALLDEVEPLLRANAVELDSFFESIPTFSNSQDYRGIKGLMDIGRLTLSATQIPPHKGASHVLRTLEAAAIAAARMMIVARSRHEFGWSHCLSLPEAAWLLAEISDSRQCAVAGLAYVCSHIATLGFPGWPDLPDASEQNQAIGDFRNILLTSDSIASAPNVGLRLNSHAIPYAWGLIATTASILDDAHLVKYTHSCIRSSARSPGAERIFLAAATKLLTIWMHKTDFFNTYKETVQLLRN